MDSHYDYRDILRQQEFLSQQLKFERRKVLQMTADMAAERNAYLQPQKHAEQPKPKNKTKKLLLLL